MTQLDPKIVEALNAAGSGETLSLLVTCEASCEPVVEQLRSAGVRVANTIPDMTVIVLEAGKQDLPALEGLTGVTAIELDSEAHALG